LHQAHWYRALPKIPGTNDAGDRLSESITRAYKAACRFPSLFTVFFFHRGQLRWSVRCNLTWSKVVRYGEDGFSVQKSLIIKHQNANIEMTEMRTSRYNHEPTCQMLLIYAVRTPYVKVRAFSRRATYLQLLHCM
jgi:hypothetical protein